MKKSKGFWRNPWTVSIGSSLVIFVITIIIDMITAEKVFSTIKVIFCLILKDSLAFLNFELKVWWLLIGGVVLIFILWGYGKYQDSKQSVLTKPQFLEYNQDRLLGYKWKWTWEKDYCGKYGIENLHPICSKCSTPLVYKYTGYGRLKCLRCGEVYQNELPDEDEVKMLISDNVRRKYFPDE